MFNPALPRGAFARVLFIVASIFAGFFALCNGARAQGFPCATYADTLEIVRDLQRDQPGSVILEYRDGEARKLMAAINALPPVSDDMSNRVIAFLRVDGIVGYAFVQDNDCVSRPGRLTPEMWEKVKNSAHPEGDI